MAKIVYLHHPWRRGLGLLAVLLVVVAIGIAFIREARTALKILLLLPDFFPNSALRPLTWVSSAPVLEEVAYPSAGMTIIADLYRPAHTRQYGAVIFTLGVNPLPRRDPIVMKVADGLARTGMVVLVPESPGLYQGRIGPEEVDHLVNAALYLSQQDFVDPKRVGYLGISVGASLSLLAASDQRINEQVSFVVAFGGYYDALDLVRAIATRRVRWQGQEEPWTPHELSLSNFTRVLIEGLESPTDRQLLQRTLLEGDRMAQGRLGELTPEGLLIYQLLTATDPQQAEELLAQLPSRMIQRLQEMSPITRIDGLKARVFIMHDRRDTFIPYVESRRLRESLKDKNPYYTEFSLFEHVLPTRGVDLPIFLQEIFKLFAVAYRVLLLVT